MYRSCTAKWASSALRWRRSAWRSQLQCVSATALEHPRWRPLSASLWVSVAYIAVLPSRRCFWCLSLSLLWQLAPYLGGALSQILYQSVQLSAYSCLHDTKSMLRACSDWLCMVLQRMAAEVVELEEKALKARSAELKGEREAAAERDAARRAQSAAKAAQQERETLQSILDTLEVTNRPCA